MCYTLCLIYHTITKNFKQLYENTLFLQTNGVNIYDNPHNVNNIHSIIIDLLYCYFL